MSVEESEDIVRCVKGLRGIQHVEIYLKHGGFADIEGIATEIERRLERDEFDVGDIEVNVGTWETIS